MAAPIHRRCICTLSTDTTVLTTISGAAAEAGIEHSGASDCETCVGPCASIVVVDANARELGDVVAGIPCTSSNVVMAIIPSTMSVQTPRQYGIEVVVYRELMEQFIMGALRLSVSFLEIADRRRRRAAA